MFPVTDLPTLFPIFSFILPTYQFFICISRIPLYSNSSFSPLIRSLPLLFAFKRDGFLFTTVKRLYLYSQLYILASLRDLGPPVSRLWGELSLLHCPLSQLSLQATQVWVGTGMSYLPHLPTWDQDEPHFPEEQIMLLEVQRSSSLSLDILKNKQLYCKLLLKEQKNKKDTKVVRKKNEDCAA